VQETGPQQPPPRRRLGLLFGIAAAVLLADVITKIIVVATLTPEHEVKVIGTLLTLDLVRNSGAAFSFGPGMTIVFTLIAVGVIFFIVRTSRRLYSTSAIACCARRGCSAARWWTGYNCRTGRSSTWPTPASCAAGSWPWCWRPGESGWTAAGIPG